MGADTSRSVGSKHKTCRRYDDAGDAHSLTFSCFKRQPFLNRDRASAQARDAVRGPLRTRTGMHMGGWAFIIHMATRAWTMPPVTRRDWIWGFWAGRPNRC